MAVMLYVRFRSLRNVEDLLYERGVDAGYVICGSLDINCDEPEGSIFRWCELKRAWHFGERIVRHAKDCYAFYRRTQYI